MSWFFFFAITFITSLFVLITTKDVLQTFSSIVFFSSGVISIVLLLRLADLRGHPLPWIIKKRQLKIIRDHAQLNFQELEKCVSLDEYLYINP